VLNTGIVGVGLFAGLVAFIIWCTTKPREQITLKQFVHELWQDERMPRWQWWVLVAVLIWKL
jgi:hypothetical protein